MSTESMVTQAALADGLRYIATILEANASKFAVPDHIPQKARKCREAADLLARTASQPEREAVLEEAAGGGLERAAQYHDERAAEAIQSWEAAREEGLEFANGGLRAAAEHRKYAAAIRALKTTPAPAVSRDEIVAMLERCSEIVDRNLHRQREKVEDVPRMLRQLASRIRGEGE